MSATSLRCFLGIDRKGLSEYMRQTLYHQRLAVRLWRKFSLDTINLMKAYVCEKMARLFQLKYAVKTITHKGENFASQRYVISPSEKWQRRKRKSLIESLNRKFLNSQKLIENWMHSTTPFLTILK